MICPSCKKGPLRPTKLEESLPALSCTQCHGFLLSMLSYRMWVESNPNSVNQTHDHEIEELNDSSKAMTCPKCQKFMSKYRISGETLNKLDSCGNCGELWIDNGEWQLLQSLGLINKLSSILSDPWQSNIRKQDHESSYESRYEKLLGEKEYSKIREFRDWLRKHKHIIEIKNYIARINR